MKSKDERTANLNYNKILKIIEKAIGNKSTYSDELEGVAKQLFGAKFKGVFPSDKIPILNGLCPYAIVNVDRSDQMGSHWMAICKNDNETILYDSFGRHDTKIIPSLRYTGNGRIINTEKDPEQEIKEQNCGARCVAWLYLYDKFGKKQALLI